MQSLESVEEALVKLENLLQELHVSSSNSGKEDLQAACSDLEMIRRLKKEAEFLEAYPFEQKQNIYLEVSLLALLFYLIQYLLAKHVLLRKDSNALIQIFDLIVSGTVPFMDFQCTELIMPSWAVHHDTARREYLLRLLLVSAYVFVFWSKARRWNKQRF